MALPASLRHAVNEILDGTPTPTLARAASALSRHYRTGERRIPGDLHALAYIATRFPATYASAESVFEEVRRLCPSFEPRTVLDVGAGPATATLAAQRVWPSVREAVLLEPDSGMRRVGRALVGTVPLTVRFLEETVDAVRSAGRFDLVVANYLLGELPAVDAVIDDLWAATSSTVAVIEPGTPNGYARMLTARERILREGGITVAPCTHNGSCPLETGDWCHFVKRLPRMPVHRRAKQADRPFEDEKYSYVVISRTGPVSGGSRLIRPPRRRKGLVETIECAADGIERRTTTRRHGAAFDEVRKLRWGDRRLRP